MVFRTSKKDSMKVGIFGISRSGKNGTIDHFMEIAEKNGCNFTPICPMDEIRRRLNGRQLKYMSAEEKMELIREVREMIDEIALTENVIIDEHCCFPATIGGVAPQDGYHDEKLPNTVVRLDGCKTDYEVVITEEQLMRYDYLVILDIPAEIISERMRRSEGVKRNTTITLDEIREWEYAENRILRQFNVGPIPYRITEPVYTSQVLWDYL